MEEEDQGRAHAVVLRTALAAVGMVLAAAIDVGLLDGALYHLVAVALQLL